MTIKGVKRITLSIEFEDGGHRSKGYLFVTTCLSDLLLQHTLRQMTAGVIKDVQHVSRTTQAPGADQ